MKNNIKQDLTLILGELTEEIFFRLRDFISQTILFTQKQLIDITDHPNIKNYFINININELIKSLDKLQSLSNETLLNLLYSYSEFLRYITKFIDAFEPSLMNSIFNDIQIQSLYTSSILRLDTNDVLIKSNNQIIDISTIEKNLNTNYYNQIFILIPSLLSSEVIWEKSVEPMLVDNNHYTIKIQLNPFLSIEENTIKTWEIIYNILKKTKSVNIIAFSTGNYILRSLLLNYHQNLINKINKIYMISSPEYGIKIERFILWAGVGFEYDSLKSIKLLKILTNPMIKIVNEFDKNFLMEYDNIQKEKNLWNSFDIYKIYSLISTNNHVWSSWIGDGIVEEDSLSFYDDIINPDHLFVINGISHLQILESPELKNILKTII